MKIKNVFQLFALLVLFVTLQSRSTGPGSTQGLEVTGAPGSTGTTGTCANAGCHASGAFDPSLSIKLLDGGNTVTTYQTGKTYMLRVSLSAGNGTPERYGFQALALNGSNAQAGEWGELGSGKKKVTLSNRSYAEHSTPSVGSVFEIEWEAPAAGTGDVTFYSAGIASNNSSTSAGDGTANNTLVVEEDPLNSISSQTGEQASLKVLPNPVHETLNLQINSLVAGQFSVRIMDAMGRVVSQTPANVLVGEQVATVGVGHLAPGVYIVQLCGEGHLGAVQMVKD